MEAYIGESVRSINSSKYTGIHKYVGFVNCKHQRYAQVGAGGLSRRFWPRSHYQGRQACQTDRDRHADVHVYAQVPSHRNGSEHREDYLLH